MKYLFLFAFIVLCSCKNTIASQNQLTSKVHLKSAKPNIIVIVVDDAGYVDFGFMGSEDLETPNIDSLAKDGVVFTDAHVTASVCAPSRAFWF
jgi:arylsulfatase A-like enzyme